MKSGSNAGIAVFDYKEPILKGKNCNCMYVQHFFKNHSHCCWDGPLIEFMCCACVDCIVNDAY